MSVVFLGEKSASHSEFEVLSGLESSVDNHTAGLYQRLKLNSDESARFRDGCLAVGRECRVPNTLTLVSHPERA